MSFIATIILILIAGDLAWWWRAHRLLRARRYARRWQAGLAVFSILQLAGLGVVLLSRRHGAVFDVVASTPLLAIVYVWHLLILLPTLAVWLVVDSLRGVGALFRRLRAQRTPSSAGLSRREFIASAAALTPAALSLGTTAVALPQLRHFRIRPLEIPLAALPPALDGLTIAHVSDVHVGRFTQGAVLDDIVRETNALDADLILMTGDLINFALSDLGTALDFVHRLRSRHGTFMCEGNHDLIEDGAAFARRTREAGVSLLIGESRVLDVRGQRVQLLGLPWAHGDAGTATAAERLLAQRQADAFPILLAHHPHAFDFAADIPLTLSGHTHGGQIMFSEKSGFGPWLFRYWSGLYAQDARALVVSNGAGNWFPLRTHAPAEILHLTLRGAGSGGRETHAG